jgi:FKBP-type peptidyl-prolyl cis-trans isomerase 2
MQKGDFIRIEYVGRLESGEVFDLTDSELAKKEKIFSPHARYGAVPIIVGAGFVVPGVDYALQSMNVGEKREVRIEPEKGFGQRDAKLVRVVPSRLFKQTPAPGQIVDFGTMRGRVQSVSAGRVRVDFNHPLAGKQLAYELEVKGKIDGVKAQTEAVLEFFGAKGDVRIEEKAVNIDAKLPQQLKERVSKLILEHVKGVEKVNFVESFEKPAPAEGVGKS